MNKNLVNWLLFILLSIVWGSSFILMKIGLYELSAYQVAALRIVSSGIVLLPTAIKYIRKIPAGKVGIIFLSGVLGNLVPAFLFCIAEEGIDSALAGALNSLTPIFVIITGALFFHANTSLNKVLGIITAFTGSVLLLFSKGHMQENQHMVHISLIVLATIMYGFNVNMVHKKLHEIPSLQIAAIALTLNAIPALAVLIFTGYFDLPLGNKDVLLSTGAASVLGVVGTAIATVLFYMLMKRAGSIFASMVTYGIPFVAIGWGILAGEVYGWLQVGCLVIILAGVYWANRRK